MNYRLLGRTGLKVSEVGYGCWGIGGGVKNPRWADMWKADDIESREALRKAFMMGVNFYDTAWVYGDGHSEKLVGELLREHPEIIVATKVPPKNREWPARLDVPAGEVFPKDYVIEYAKKSYNNLGRKIDLLQLHVWSDKWVNDEGWQESFDELKKENIIRFTGVSINDHAPETALKLVASGKVDCLQVIYNIFDQSPEDELFRVAKKNNIGIIARVPLDEGSLTGKFTYDTKFDDWRKYYFSGNRLKETIDRVEKLRFLEGKNKTLAQAALQFILANDAVSTVIPGMRKGAHVVDNVKASEGKISEKELKELRKHRWDRNFYYEGI